MLPSSQVFFLDVALVLFCSSWQEEQSSWSKSHCCESCCKQCCSLCHYCAAEQLCALCSIVLFASSVGAPMPSVSGGQA